MFRGFMPALTLIVFGIGLGLGVSWTRGLIPLTISPAKSGSLSAEFSQRELLPPPNERALASVRRGKTSRFQAIADDPEVFEQQSEPESDGSATAAKVAETNPFLEMDRSRIVHANRESDGVEPPDGVEQENPETNYPRVRLRERRTAQIELDRDSDDASASRRGRAVMAAAHQDPTETSGEAREAGRESAESSHSLPEHLAAAEAKIAAGETREAHRDLSKLYWNHKEFRPKLQEAIDTTAKAIFFQSQPHFVEPYVIQPGDRLEVVARKYQLSWEYLAKLNRTEPRRVQIGQKLKVVKGPFGAVVDLQDFSLIIHLQGYYVKRYTVGIGKDGSSPVGKFSVLNKLENPQYTGPDGKVVQGDDPSNPLGERWIDLGDSYGIHGTIDPDSIGKASSRGCIRLRDKDIVDVYDFLVKGSEVVLRK
jgi:lipoprotein-anchoring transpeptidase ErfK/SrfK